MYPRRITEGGFWRSARPKYSEDTINFMEVLIKESRLPFIQKQRIQRSLYEKQPLPVDPRRKDAQGRSIEILFESNQKIFHKVRTRADIVLSGAYKCQPFHPKKDESDRNKERLQNIMAFGSEQQETPTPSPTKSKDISFSMETLEYEIKEREEFLASMEKIGKEKKYRPIIDSQISKRYRDLQLMKTGKPVPLDHI